MKKIVNVSFKKIEEEVTEESQCLAKLPPSGSGSGDYGSGSGDGGSGSGDSGSGDSSGLSISGTGELELVPTIFSHNNYRWDIEGKVKWSASGKMVLVDGTWILDTSSLSIDINKTNMKISINGGTYTESGIEYISASQKVSIEGSKIVNERPHLFVIHQTTVGGSAKVIKTGVILHTYDYNQDIVLNITFFIAALGCVKLVAETGTISVSVS